MLVGPGVQVQADHGQRTGSESCQPIDLLGEHIGHSVKTALCVEHETDQLRLGGTAAVTRRNVLGKRCRSCTSSAGVAIALGSLLLPLDSSVGRSQLSTYL